MDIKDVDKRIQTCILILIILSTLVHIMSLFAWTEYISGNLFKTITVIMVNLFMFGTTIFAMNYNKKIDDYIKKQSEGNNGYGCNHPSQENIEEFEGKDYGQCQRKSCPLGIPLSPNEEPEDRVYFDNDDWKNMTDGDWMLVNKDITERKEKKLVEICPQCRNPVSAKILPDIFVCIENHKWDRHTGKIIDQFR